MAACKLSLRLHRQTRSRKLISSDLAVTYVSNAVPVIGVGALASVTGPVVASLIFAAIIALVATANNLIASLISPPLARERSVQPAGEVADSVQCASRRDDALPQLPRDLPV